MQHSVPYQQFVLRQDKNGGSTIGPILSTHEGIYTLDCGLPQLSMHSIRETMGSKDVKNGTDFVKFFLEDFGDVWVDSLFLFYRCVIRFIWMNKWNWNDLFV